MNEQWQERLNEDGARFAQGRVLDYGDADGERYRALRDDCLFDLSHLAVLRLSGDDAADFLQAQLTSDVTLLDETHSQLSAWCTPKGRVIGCWQILYWQQAWWLLIPEWQLATVAQRLKFYVLRARVDIEILSDEYERLGLSGPAAADLLRQTVGIAPDTDNAMLTTDDTAVIRIAGPVPRFIVLGKAAPMSSLWQSLIGQAVPAGTPVWDLFDVLAGRPVIQAGTSEAFVPQMLNLDALHAVSFNKGCYPGQEIVARTHYLGKIKRRMIVARINSPLPHDTLPEAGATLHSAGCGHDNNAGKVVIAVRHPDGGCALLAVVQIDCTESGRLTLDDDKTILEIQPLPYGLEQPES